MMFKYLTPSAKPQPGSRHSDGNGLGLAIAMSLMRLQKGDLDIEVDGDLFKVTLRFPKVS